MTQRYYGNWEKGGYEEMRRDFSHYTYNLNGPGRNYRAPADFPADDQIVIAGYDTPPYEGAAYVLYRSPDGQLYEVNASHCSCNGLEECWSPEATSVEALRMRPRRGYSCEQAVPEAAWQTMLEEITPKEVEL